MKSSVCHCSVVPGFSSGVNMSHLVQDLSHFPWDPLSVVSALVPDSLRSRGSCLEVTLHTSQHIKALNRQFLLSLFCLPYKHLCDSSKKNQTTATMDMSYCSPLLLQEDASSFLCNALLDTSCDPLAFDPSSDPGYYSACSSLSPTSSVDSFCFSPNLLQVKAEQEPLDSFLFSREPQQTATTTNILAKPASSATKKSRSRYPGKKRQTSSEREKLRMRELTKALHHLRSYLPASVAPEGQTLTKIETLCLTIRYISHLSAQLGLTEKVLEKRSSGPMEPALFAYSSLQETPCSSSLHPARPSTYTTPVMVPTGPCYTPQQYWVPHQQYPNMGFNGQC